MRADTESNRLKMSYEEFLQWADENTHAEWVGGEVIIHMPANEHHQLTLTFLLQILNLFVNLFDLGKVLVAPFAMRADFYYLNEQSQYELFATEDDEQVASRVLPRFWLRPSWLWEVEDRDPLLTFFEIRGLSPEQAQQIQQTLQTGPTEEKKE